MPGPKSSKTYLAISLGPIYQTITHARKTRELWAASYLFSYFMEKLYDALHSKLKTGTGEILSPLPPDATKPRFGAGVYPDRLFAVAGNLSETDLGELVDAIIASFAKAVWCPPANHKLDDKALATLRLRQNEEKATIEYWKAYLRVVHVFIDLSESDNILAQLNDRLDTLELQPTYFHQEPATNFLLRLLDNPYQSAIRSALLPKDNQESNAYRHLKKAVFNNSLFPSTSDVATLELYQLDGTNYEIALKQAQNDTKESDPDNDRVQEALYARLAGQQTPLGAAFQQYHKYYCVVYADGDEFGQTIKKLGANASMITKFSKAIARFATDAASTINEFGGKPVYIGGDDLVFLAPVRTDQGNVFACIQALHDVFQAIKEDQAFAGVFAKETDLSFGLTISYFKFPLFEAINQAYDQLNNRAKKFQRSNQGAKKAAVAYRLLKHSGSFFEGIIARERLDELIGFAPAGHAGVHTNLLRSVLYKFNELAPLVRALDEQGALQSRLGNLRRNYFNEPVHRQYEAQIEAVATLLASEFTITSTVGGEPLPRMDNFYATLRVLDYLTPKSKAQTYESAF